MFKKNTCICGTLLPTCGEGEDTILFCGTTAAVTYIYNVNVV